MTLFLVLFLIIASVSSSFLFVNIFIPSCSLAGESRYDWFARFAGAACDQPHARRLQRHCDHGRCVRRRIRQRQWQRQRRCQWKCQCQWRQRRRYQRRCSSVVGDLIAQRRIRVSQRSARAVRHADVGRTNTAAVSRFMTMSYEFDLFCCRHQSGSVNLLITIFTFVFYLVLYSVIVFFSNKNHFTFIDMICIWLKISFDRWQILGKSCGRKNLKKSRSNYINIICICCPVFISSHSIRIKSR